MTAKQLRDFLLWCRKERISFTTITAGGVTLDGYRDGKASAEKAQPAEPAKSDWERRAEALLNTPAAPVDSVPDETKMD